MSTTISKPSEAPAPRVPLLDTDQVATALRVTPRHVRRLVAERRIPFFKVGRLVRFDPGELDVWLEQQRVGVVRRGSRGTGTAAR
jgi:excisionase family DNA binding protein